jgi:CLIP-associating protein 1/2
VRIPNQYIYTASLSAIAALFPILVTSDAAEHTTFTAHDVAVLRHGLLAFLSPGGILDRLGDNREKARDCAREALVSAGNVAFKYSSHTPIHPGKSTQSAKGPETPLAIFERSMRDLGFGSKVSRVREQVGLRRLPQFPVLTSY